jgi:hypothetical protein
MASISGSWVHTNTRNKCVDPGPRNRGPTSLLALKIRTPVANTGKLRSIGQVPRVAPDGFWVSFCLHPRLLFEIKVSIAEPLRIIFNQSLTLKTVPKNGKTHKLVQYSRKVINHRQLWRTNKQYCFIAGRSTALQLLEAKTEPCGMPEVIYFRFDVSPFIDTCWLSLVRKSCIQLKIGLVMP